MCRTGRRIPSLLSHVHGDRLSAMTMQTLKEIHHAEPFRPYTLHFADGGTVRVTHPESLAYNPSGRTAVVVFPDDSTQWFDVLLVSRIEMSNGQGKKRSKS